MQRYTDTHLAIKPTNLHIYMHAVGIQ